MVLWRRSVALESTTNCWLSMVRTLNVPPRRLLPLLSSTSRLSWTQTGDCVDISHVYCLLISPWKVSFYCFDTVGSVTERACSRPHRRGGRFFTGGNLIWHRLVGSIAVGCRSRGVMPLLKIEWSFLLYIPQQKLPMLFSELDNPQNYPPPWRDLYLYLIRGALDPHKSHPPSGISIGSATSAQHVCVTNTQTDRHTDHAMRPTNTAPITANAGTRSNLM